MLSDEDAVPSSPKTKKKHLSKQHRVESSSSSESSQTSLHAEEKSITKKLSKTGTNKVTQSARQKRLQNRKILLRGTWVQCTNVACCRWRYLNEIHDPSDIQENWKCVLNPDKAYNTCDKPEQDAEPETQKMYYLYTKFTEGSVVWAKIDGFPWWPAMIEIDPDFEQYFNDRHYHGIASEFHVVFLDAHVTRCWVKASDVRAFTGNRAADLKNTQSATSRLSLYRPAIKAASEIASEVIKLPLPDRIRQYGFSARYTGKWAPDDKILNDSDDEEIPSNVGGKVAGAIVKKTMPKSGDLLEELLSQSQRSAATSLSQLQTPISSCETISKKVAKKGGKKRMREASQDLGSERSTQPATGSKKAAQFQAPLSQSQSYKGRSETQIPESYHSSSDRFEFLPMGKKSSNRNEDHPKEKKKKRIMSGDKPCPLSKKKSKEAKSMVTTSGKIHDNVEIQDESDDNSEAEIPDGFSKFGGKTAAKRVHQPGEFAKKFSSPSTIDELLSAVAASGPADEDQNCDDNTVMDSELATEYSVEHSSAKQKLDETKCKTKRRKHSSNQKSVDEAPTGSIGTIVENTEEAKKISSPDTIENILASVADGIDVDDVFSSDGFVENSEKANVPTTPKVMGTTTKSRKNIGKNSSFICSVKQVAKSANNKIKGNETAENVENDKFTPKVVKTASKKNLGDKKKPTFPMTKTKETLQEPKPSISRNDSNKENINPLLGDTNDTNTSQAKKKKKAKFVAPSQSSKCTNSQSSHGGDNDSLSQIQNPTPPDNEGVFSQKSNSELSETQLPFVEVFASQTPASSMASKSQSGVTQSGVTQSGVTTQHDVEECESMPVTQSYSGMTLTDKVGAKVKATPHPGAVKLNTSTQDSIMNNRSTNPSNITESLTTSDLTLTDKVGPKAKTTPHPGQRKLGAALSLDGSSGVTSNADTSDLTLTDKVGPKAKGTPRPQKTKLITSSSEKSSKDSKNTSKNLPLSQDIICSQNTIESSQPSDTHDFSSSNDDSDKEDEIPRNKNQQATIADLTQSQALVVATDDDAGSDSDPYDD